MAAHLLPEEGVMLSPDLRKGSAELIILALLEHDARHGYELGKLIELRSGGVLHYHVASLYPLLYRLQRRGWIRGRWVENAGTRRRRYYRITAAGAKVLEAQRHGWHEFVHAVSAIVEVQHA